MQLGIVVFLLFFSVPETRHVLLDFLEKEKNANLLLFYERISSFLTNLRKGYKEETTIVTGNGSPPFANSSQGSTNVTPATPSSSIPSKSNKQSNRNSLLSTSSTNFDMYFEVEILLHDFLEPSSKYYISHFDYLRKSVVAAIKERKQGEVEEVDSEQEDAIFYAATFHDFTNSVYTKLKYDIFSRLVRTEVIANFFKSFSEQERTTLLQKVAKKKQTDFHNILYTEKQFSEELLLEKDFMFVFQLIHDNSSIWTPIFHVDESDDSSASAFYTTQSFMVDSKEQDKVIMLKYMGYLPYNVEDCAKFFFNGDFSTKLDDSIIDTKFVEIHLPNKEEESKKPFLERKVASSINYCNIKLGSLLTKRDVVTNSSLRYLPHLDEYIQVSKPVIHQDYPEKKNRIRAKILSGFTFERIASNETRFTLVTYFQLGGWLKQLGKALTKIAKARCKIFVQSYKRAIENSMKEQKEWREYLKEPVDTTMGFPQVFEWNEQNIASEEVKSHYKGFSNKNLFDLAPKKESKRLVVRI